MPFTDPLWLSYVGFALVARESTQLRMIFPPKQSLLVVQK
jgi:hypothetical protein